MKHRRIYIILAVSFFLVVVPFATAKEQAIINFDSPDPVVIEEKDGSGFYAFTTKPGIAIWHSTDLLHWERSGQVFDEAVPAFAKERIAGARAIWAPDIVYLNGKFHLYYSVSTFGGQRSLIGLVVNKTLNPKNPDYKWEHVGIVLESAPPSDKFQATDTATDYNAIDSAVFIDEDGKAYLYWGSYWTGLKAVEIDAKTGLPFEYEKNRKDDLKVPANYVAIATRSAESKTTAIEAPFVVKHGKSYYLFVSWDSCCDFEKSTYKIALGRSEKPLGPFVDQNGKAMTDGGGTLIMQSTDRWKGTGHNGFLRTQNHGDWLILAAYDAGQPRRGRLTQVRPFYWTEDGWGKPGAILEVPYKQFDWTKAPSDPTAE